MIHFKNLLSRADVPTLEALIGASAVRLLKALDPQLVRGPSLRKLLTDLWPAHELLTKRDTRAQLVDLLDTSDATKLAGELGLSQVQQDPYRTLQALKLKRGTKKHTLFLGYFGISQPEADEVHLPPDEVLVAPTYSLFDYQRQAAKRVSAALRTGERRVLLHMPTGAGKTRTAMHAIAEHLANSAPTSVLWLAYSEELCEQAATEFERAWRALGNRNLAVCRFWGSREPKLENCRDGFVVAGLAKLYKRAIDDLQFIGTLADRVSLVIIDEAHQAIAETYRLTLDTLHQKRPDTALLGLTATPGRSWADIDADRELADFFARQKVTLEVPGWANPVQYLIDQGYLAKPSFKTLLHDGGRLISADDLAAIERELDIPPRILSKLASDEQRNLRIVVEVEHLSGRHNRVLLFAATVEHARLLATALQAHGEVEARVVTGETSLHERRETIAWYKAEGGGTRVLCNYGVLTTGFDAPQTSAALIARPTKSLVLYSQMVGRAIRGPEAGGNETAEIVTVVDTRLPGFRDVAESFLNWEDAGWENPTT